MISNNPTAQRCEQTVIISEKYEGIKVRGQLICCQQELNQAAVWDWSDYIKVFKFRQKRAKSTSSLDILTTHNRTNSWIQLSPPSS